MYVDQFVDWFFDKIREAGGSEKFFETLDDSVYSAMSAFSHPQRYSRLLFKAIDEAEFQKNISDALPEISKKDEFDRIINNLRVWSGAYSSVYEGVKDLFGVDRSEAYTNQFPMLLNDILAAEGGIEVSTYAEEVMVRCAVQLASPDKKLGGDDHIIISTRISNYVMGVNVMLRALLLEDTEKRYFDIDRFPDDKVAFEGAIRRIVKTTNDIIEGYGLVTE